MPEHADLDTAHHYETGRLEAFSDGVFAIAITLLVLEIAVPHVEHDASLTNALLDLWPSYFGYAVSFITIGVMWINHHHMFKDIERVDHGLLALNLLLLICISFVPFPTAVLAEYVGEDEFRLEAPSRTRQRSPSSRSRSTRCGSTLLEERVCSIRTSLKRGSGVGRVDIFPGRWRMASRCPRSSSRHG
jgi:hypothetical protein